MNVENMWQQLLRVTDTHESTAVAIIKYQKVSSRDNMKTGTVAIR